MRSDKRLARCCCGECDAVQMLQALRSGISGFVIAWRAMRALERRRVSTQSSCRQTPVSCDDAWDMLTGQQTRHCDGWQQSTGKSTNRLLKWTEKKLITARPGCVLMSSYLILLGVNPYPHNSSSDVLWKWYVIIPLSVWANTNSTQ